MGTGAPSSPGDVEAQIDDAWTKLEPLIEQYNQVHGQLQATQAKIDVLQRQMDPLQMQVDLAMTRVRAIAAQLYKTGPGSRTLALINSGGPETFVDQMTALDQLARQQNAQVAAAASMRDTFAAQKKPLDDLQAKLAAQDADLAQKKNTIQAQLDQLQKLRLAAYGSSGQALGNLRPVACPMEYLGDKGSQAAKKACSLIGKPYVWGAATLLEMRADDVAARRHGRHTVAAAIAALSRRPAPVGALGVAGPSALARGLSPV
jgi:hypothetical protein